MVFNRFVLILLILMKNLNGFSALQSSLMGECHDSHGQTIEQGRHYVPGPDLCKLCICDNGHPKGCKAVLCSPPQACKSFQIGNSCCEFICLDDTLNGNSDKNSDFGMRLIASGITATLSLSLLFFIVNRFRQRKIRVSTNRQNNEEPRNMASIGYIGGNLNYMGGGNMNIDYPYDNNPNQYNLWKPSSGYFPRGEAPPPYEEAVAQIEGVSAQCTVSVATTTHSAAEGQFEVQPGITTSTTNLININISNSGNITAVAAGENHQINKCYSTINNSNQLRIQPNQSQPAQYSSLPLNSSTNINNHHRNDSNGNQIEPIPSEMYSVATISAIATPETTTNAIACNYKNCNQSSLNSNKNYRKADVVFQTPQQHNRVKRQYDKDFDNGLVLSHNQSTHAILPPPLFDEATISSKTLPMIQNDSFRQIKSRRHHRTIPRHFTIAEPTLLPMVVTTKQKHYSDENAKISQQQQCSTTVPSNKKSICQCPVQHVPMTYMGSTHLNLTRSQPNEILLTTLSRKLSHPKTNVAKSASFTSSSIATVPSSSIAQNYNRNSASGLLSANTVVTKSNSNASLNISSQNNNTLHRQKSPMKIPTISKQIGNTEIDNIAYSNDSKHHRSQEQPLKNQTIGISDELKPTPMINNDEIFASPFPIQFIESMGKSKKKDHHTVNPALPPKMCKINSNSHLTQKSENLSHSARIQTISKPPSGTLLTTNQVVAIQNHSKHIQHQVAQRDHSKSSSREKAHSLSNANTNDCKIANQSKTNYPTSFLTLSNHYTLPKSTTAKMSLNSTITDVVNKVPSIINIPTTYRNKATIKSSHNSTANIVTTNNDSNRPSTSIACRSNYKLNDIAITAAAITQSKIEDKPLPVCTTYKNCSNPKEHFLPNDTSLDDDYLSECENCKSAHGSRYYLDEEIEEQPQETMTLQRKMDEKEDEIISYYRTSSTLPTNTKQKPTIIKNREPWFSTIPGSSSSDEDAAKPY